MKIRGSRSLTLTRLILEKLSEAGEAAIESFFPASYPEARFWRQLLGYDRRHRFKRETFSVLLSRLRASGLVARVGARRDGRWQATPRGEKYLRQAARPASDGVRRIVIFDIPERERRKRDALRIELVAAGFAPLQKSVWCGERPLPPDFIELVDALQLRPFVHIFSVAAGGTLSRK